MRGGGGVLAHNGLALMLAANPRHAKGLKYYKTDLL
jgi:hypothetical protein